MDGHGLETAMGWPDDAARKKAKPDRRRARILALALTALAAAPAAHATTDDEAIALCREALVETYGGQDIRNVAVYHGEGVPFVFGDADFPEVAGVQFRCRVYQGRVWSVEYLDPNAGNGTDWAALSPEDAPPPEASPYMPAGDAPAAPAKGAAPTDEIRPHFETPPSD